MRRSGVPPQEIQALIREHSNHDEGLCLDDVELDAVRVFSRVQSQWRRGAQSGLPEGLDYAGVESVARIMGVELTDGVFECLQVMEVTATKEFLDRAKRDNGS